MLLLVGLCAEHALTITNTLFLIPDRFKIKSRLARLAHENDPEVSISRPQRDSVKPSTEISRQAGGSKK